jgi:hypothetical protein
MILTSSREDFIPLLESTAAAELGHARSTMASLFDFGVCCRLAFVVHVGMMGAGGGGGGLWFCDCCQTFFLLSPVQVLRSAIRRISCPTFSAGFCS